MSNIPGNNNTPVTRFANWVIKRRWFVLLGTLIVVMGAGMGGQNIRFNNDYHIFFDEDNPQVLAFDALQEKYTKDDNVFIVIAPKSGEVFTKETLTAIQELEKEAWQTPFSSRVDALSNYQHTRSEGDDMFVEPLFEDPESLTEARLGEIKEIVMQEPVLKDRLINDNASVTAINITVTLPADSMDAPQVVAQFALKMVEDWKQKYPGHDTYLSGIVMMNNAFYEGAMGDMTSLVPLMFLVIILVVLLTTRSLSAMITSTVVLFLSIMFAMGMAGWFHVELSGPSTSAPTMIMTLAIADSIHLIVTMLQLMRKGMDKRMAIVESVRVNFMPVFMTSATTIIGFLTLNFAEGAPFHDLGNITATGVAGAFLLSMFALPALMAILPVKARGKTKEGGNYLSKLADFVIAKRTPILIGSVVIVLGLSALITRNVLNNQFVNFFAPSMQFRSDTDFISENLTGIYNVEFSLGAGEPDGIGSPAYLQDMDAFEEWCRQQPEVTHVNAFSRVMKQVNKSMHGDSSNYYTVPAAKNEAAQYLLLYEMSLPYGLDLNNQINVDKSETRFTITTKNISSNEMMSLSDRAEAYLKENTPEHMHAVGISPTIMFSHITKSNMDSMIKSGIGALFLISFILIFALRSLKYGIVSIVPNLTPICVAFGIWGLANGQINMALAVVLGMTLGIVVDDTIHLLSKYIRARREMNLSAEDAVRYAFITVGQAVIVTTIILTAGFSVLMFSSFGLNSGMGKLTAITIVAALLLDLFLLPTLLLAIDRKKPKTEPEFGEDEALS